VGLLLAGYPIVSIDNVNGELGGDLLCQATERPLIRLRPLGASTIIEIESCVSFFATGGNLRIRGDMVRRSLLAALDPQLERPELRIFKNDPAAMIQADRGRYVSTVLVIVRAYIAAGMPGKLAPIASFGPWSDMVRSALVWLGAADPALSMERAREDDPELGDLREVLEIWKSDIGIGLEHAETVRHVAEKASTCPPSKMGKPTGFAYPDLRDVLLRIAGAGGNINTRMLGNWLSGREGRIVDDFKFTRHPTLDRTGTVRWAVVNAAEQVAS
jgi:putative DNA primase/helicase